MKPLPFIWPISLPFWLAYGLSFANELPHIRKTSATRVPQTDRGSMHVIVWTGMLAGISAFFLAGAMRSAAMSNAVVPYIVGVVLMLCSTLLRRHCFTMLGDRFTFAVRATSDQLVVERGAYRYVRHPGYTAGLMLFAGIGLALANWASFAVCIILPAMAYGYRIAVEERLLRETLGASYYEYMKRTRSRLVPYLF